MAPNCIARSTLNVWDNSPSTVQEGIQDDSQEKCDGLGDSFDHYFTPSTDDHDDYDQNVRKQLFSDHVDQSRLSALGDRLYGEILEENQTNVCDGDVRFVDIEVSDNSDKELTQRARAIQFDVRLLEMRDGIGHGGGASG